MNIQVVVRGADSAARLRGFAEDKLAKALERFADRVQSAMVRLEDETGPAKHGVDKLCSIEVKLRNGEIRVRERGDDFYATIDLAVDRLKASLSRQAGRTKHGIGGG